MWSRLCRLGAAQSLRRAGAGKAHVRCSSTSAGELFAQQQAKDHSDSAWGTYAAQYDHGFGVKFQRYASGVLDILSRAGALHSSQTLLDIGCGTGAVLDAISQQYAHSGECNLPSQYIGIDFSQEMIDYCVSEKSKQVASRDNAEALHSRFARMDAMDLNGIDSDSVDVVMSLFALIFAPNRVTALSEAKRVLKGGGYVSCSGWGPVESVEWIAFSNQVIIVTWLPSHVLTRISCMGTYIHCCVFMMCTCRPSRLLSVQTRSHKWGLNCHRLEGSACQTSCAGASWKMANGSSARQDWRMYLQRR